MKIPPLKIPTNPGPNASGNLVITARVAALQNIFGRDVVMVPTKTGTKEPFQKGYPNFEIEVMQEPDHLQILESNNIAILTGPNSGNLISIDFDGTEAFNEFALLNPVIIQSTLTGAARGCNLWLRMVGGYPTGMKRLTKTGPEGETIELGEWRAGGCITIIWGRHPAGMDYGIDQRWPVRQIRFADIRWPADWNHPGKADPSEELSREYGPPFFEGRSGGLELNERFFVGLIETENEIAYAFETKSFFRFEPDRNLWVSLPDLEIEKLIAERIARIANEGAMEKLHSRIRQGVIGSIRCQLQAAVGCEFFKQSFTGGWKPIPVENGIVVFILPDSETGPQFCFLSGDNARRFSVAGHFIAKSPVRYEPDAECPRFLNELLAPVLDPEDISLLQRLFGLVLVGKNILQKIINIEGPGGIGKGVFAEVIDMILGESSVAELRTEHLCERFEVRRFICKRLLAGRDVLSDFLQTRGASKLKALTGGDLLSTEGKYRDDDVRLRGTFHVMIVSNSPMYLRLDSDVSAWERRLVVIPFHPPAVVPKKIRNFARILVDEEGAGILKWLLEGATQAHREVLEYGDLFYTGKQLARIETRIRESDSIAYFFDQHVEIMNGARVLSQHLLMAYQNFCAGKGLPCVADRRFMVDVKQIITARCGECYNENITVGGTRGRGYVGVALK